MQAEQTPAERKAREALNKALEKEAEKKQTARARGAQSAIAKVEPTIAATELLMAKDHWDEVAETIRVPVETKLATFRKIVQDARAIVDGNTTIKLVDIKDRITRDSSTTVAKHLAACIVAFESGLPLTKLQRLHVCARACIVKRHAALVG